MNAKVILLTTKQGPVLKGHPWIFPKAIAKTQGSLKTGALVDVYNEQNEFIGIGAYNEHSLYRVRVLALSANAKQFNDYHSLIAHRLMQAKMLRDSLNLPNNKTTAYRLFNSEADGLSGLTIDRFNQTCVVSSTTYWVELNKELLMKAIRVLFPADEIHWLAQAKPLAQDGWHEKSSPIATSIQAQVLELFVRTFVSRI